jgi:hypothetical protein
VLEGTELGTHSTLVASRMNNIDSVLTTERSEASVYKLLTTVLQSRAERTAKGGRGYARVWRDKDDEESVSFGMTLVSPCCCLAIRTQSPGSEVGRDTPVALLDEDAAALPAYMRLVQAELPASKLPVSSDMLNSSRDQSNRSVMYEDLSASRVHSRCSRTCRWAQHQAERLEPCELSSVPGGRRGQDGFVGRARQGLTSCDKDSTDAEMVGEIRAGRAMAE